MGANDDDSDGLCYVSVEGRQIGRIDTRIAIRQCLGASSRLEECECPGATEL